MNNTLNVDSKVYSVVVFNPSVRETGDPFVAVGCGDAVIRLYSLDSQLNNNSKRKIPLMSSPEHNFSSYDDCQLNALFLAVQHSSWPLQPDRFI